MKLDELSPTMSITSAARLLGIGRNQAYRAAALGQLPTLRVGGRILVLTAPLYRMLGLQSDQADGHGASAASDRVEPMSTKR